MAFRRGNPYGVEINENHRAPAEKHYNAAELAIYLSKSTTKLMKRMKEIDYEEERAWANTRMNRVGGMESDLEL